MQTKNRNGMAPNLGEMVEAAYDLGEAMTPNSATVSELAARHLERVLVRGSNARLMAMLENLAAELAPMTVRRRYIPRFHERPARPAHRAVRHRREARAA
jgi:hypothetical protein